MIHGYHVIWGTYGFWLPNDPRGSWSDFVASWELARFGKSTKSIERRIVDSSQWIAWRKTAQNSLQHPEVFLSELQANAIGIGFESGILKSAYTVWACSILPQHVHLVIARHRYKVEQICNLLKGEATKSLKAMSMHPFSACSETTGKFPSLWAELQWKVYLDDEEAIDNAIHYVERNPIKEGKPPQNWSFVAPFRGIDKSGWTTYH